MVTPEELSGLDHLQWLRTGAAAARTLRCSQPTVSRRVAQALSRIGRSLRRQGGEVIDAWIAGYLPDLPAADDSEFAVIELCHTPCKLQAARNHPLACETGLTAADLALFPSLALPEGWFPRLEARLKAQNLWSTPSVRFRRYDESSWEGRTADAVTLCHGNALSLTLHPELVPLDWNIGHLGGEALVVRRDLAERGPILLLLQELQRRVRQLACQHAERIALRD